MALNIQRARDHGIPDYNTVRKAYGLPEITEWTDINPDLLTEKPWVSCIHLYIAPIAQSVCVLDFNFEQAV